jgi:glucosylceramidase
MHTINALIVFIVLFASLSSKGIVHSSNKSANSASGKSKTSVAFWLTSPETNVLFQRQTDGLVFVNLANEDETITVDATKTFQSIDGFGNCLTGGSATLLHRMDAASRSAILKELFATNGNNIGISYLRVSIGASDLSDRVFSYDDLPEGETDPSMTKFTLDAERVDLIPVLKQILAHAAKFVRPGSVRIDSNSTSSLPNVAFKTPDGKKVLIVQNNCGVKKVFNIQFNGETVSASLAKDAVGTYVW